MTPPPGAPRCSRTPKPAVAHEVGGQSATKYIGGHGTAIGGVIIDSGRFDYGAHPERFPNYNQPDPSYPGKARVQLLRDLGSAVAPFNAWLIAQGLAVARWLESRPEVLSVNDAGLESSPWYQAGRKYAPLGTSGVLAFEIRGGVDAGRSFVEALKLHSHVANIGDVPAW